MNETGNFNFKFLPSDEISQRFERILKDCKGLEQHAEVSAIVNKILVNTILPVIILEPGQTFTVYRVTVNFPGFDDANIRSYSYPPPALTPRNRMNTKGHPVLYAAFNSAAAIREVVSDKNVQERIYLSEWTISLKQQTYMFVSVLNSETLQGKFLTSDLGNNISSRLHNFFSTYDGYNFDSLQQLLIRYGDLFSQKGSDFYNISSAIAHQVMYKSKEQGAQIPIMMYPSMASDQNMLNLVFHPDFAESENMTLDKVLEFHIESMESGTIKGKIKRKGRNENGAITWLRQRFELAEVIFDESFQIQLEGGKLFRGNNALELNDDQGQNITDVVQKLVYNAVRYIGGEPVDTSKMEDEFNYSDRSIDNLAVLELKPETLSILKQSVKRLVVRVRWTVGLINDHSE